MRTSRSTPSLRHVQPSSIEKVSTRAASKSSSKKTSKKKGAILLAQKNSPNKENLVPPNSATWSRGTSSSAKKKKRLSLLRMCLAKQTDENDEFTLSDEGSPVITAPLVPRRATGSGLPPPQKLSFTEFLKSKPDEQTLFGAESRTPQNAQSGMALNPSPTRMLESGVEDIPLPSIMPHRMLGAPPSDKMPHEVAWGGRITLPPKKPRKSRSTYLENLMKERRTPMPQEHDTEERKVSSCGKVLAPPSREKCDGLEQQPKDANEHSELVLETGREFETKNVIGTDSELQRAADTDILDEKDDGPSLAAE